MDFLRQSMSANANWPAFKAVEKKQEAVEEYIEEDFEQNEESPVKEDEEEDEADIKMRQLAQSHQQSKLVTHRPGIKPRPISATFDLKQPKAIQTPKTVKDTNQQKDDVLAALRAENKKLIESSTKLDLPDTKGDSLKIKNTNPFTRPFSHKEPVRPKYPAYKAPEPAVKLQKQPIVTSNPIIESSGEESKGLQYLLNRLS